MQKKQQRVLRAVCLPGWLATQINRHLTEEEKKKAREIDQNRKRRKHIDWTREKEKKENVNIKAPAHF